MTQQCLQDLQESFMASISIVFYLEKRLKTNNLIGLSLDLKLPLKKISNLHEIMTHNVTAEKNTRHFFSEKMSASVI